jgi:hypothetical protein
VSFDVVANELVTTTRLSMNHKLLATEAREETKSCRRDREKNKDEESEKKDVPAWNAASTSAGQTSSPFLPSMKGTGEAGEALTSAIVLLLFIPGRVFGGEICSVLISFFGGDSSVWVKLLKVDCAETERPIGEE